MSFNVVVWRQRFSDYENDAAFLVDWVENAGGTATQTWDLDGTHVVSGETISAHVNVTGTATEGDIYSVTKTVTGLTPNQNYTFWRKAYATEIVAGLPANQFNQLSGTVTADANGDVDVILRFTTPAGGTFDVDIWFGDVHLTEALDSDWLLDAGIVEVNDTVLGYTRGGVEIENADEWEALDFPGRKADVTEADLKRVSSLRLAMTVVSVPKVLEEAYPGITTGGGTGFVNTVYTPHPAGTVLASGDYLTNLTAHWFYGNGLLRWRFLKGVSVTPRVISKDKDEVTIRLTIEARVDRATYLTDSSSTPWVIEFLDAVS